MEPEADEAGPKAAPLAGFAFEARETALIDGQLCVAYRRAELPRTRARSLTRGDLRETAALAAAFAVALGLPASRWPAAAARLRRLADGRAPAASAALARASLGALFGRDDPALAQACADALGRQVMRKRIALAAQLLGRGSAPVIDMEGDEPLRAALAPRRGAIVWIDETHSADIMAKRALAEAGLRARMVSASIHGLSNTPFAVRFLNPVQRRAEDRWLDARMVFGRTDGADIMRRILGALSDGALVAMTNNIYAGSAFIETPLGAAGFLSLPQAPLALSLRHGVPLFPATMQEIEPLARYRLRIGPALTPAAGTAARGAAALGALALQARDHVLAAMRATPDQFPLIARLDLSRSVVPGARLAARR